MAYHLRDPGENGYTTFYEYVKALGDEPSVPVPGFVDDVSPQSAPAI